MSTTAPAEQHGATHGLDSHGHEEHIHPVGYYVKIWAILVGCLALSVAGPMLEIRVVTLITAFGIAFFKAYLVCSKFMHLNIERKFVIYFLVTAIGFMALFFFAIAPDILNHHGANWVNVGAKAEIERHGGHDGGGDVHEANPEHGKAAAEHGGGHGGGHGEIVVEENEQLKAHREAAEKKLSGIEEAMKAVATEAKGAVVGNTTTTPPPPAPETPPEAPKAPEAPKTPEH